MDLEQRDSKSGLSMDPGTEAVRSKQGPEQSWAGAGALQDWLLVLRQQAL